MKNINKKRVFLLVVLLIFVVSAISIGKTLDLTGSKIRNRITFHRASTTQSGGIYWEAARTDYWTNARTSLWSTPRNTEIP